AEQLGAERSLKFILPTLEKRERQVRDLLLGSNLPVHVVVGGRERRAAMSGAHLAMATSGTISLELGLARVPHAIFYQANGLEKVASKLVTTWSVNLPNLILDEPIVPECVGEAARVERLQRELKPLLKQGHARQRQEQGFERLWHMAATELPPAELAACALRKAADL
ncbi:MAG: lipid-A-disaccharide synthase, partial [Pseudomonadota bacterium]